MVSLKAYTRVTTDGTRAVVEVEASRSMVASLPGVGIVAEEIRRIGSMTSHMVMEEALVSLGLTMVASTKEVEVVTSPATVMVTMATCTQDHLDFMVHTIT